ncbi:hypothetical protein AB4876_09380 [Zhongshania guokunii]|uniref:Uncharacterized protein n=1 Tax=Zhongshania guokunii TaxID=641783 RepID=A0ABV3U5I2_9GAMM
MSCSDFDPRVLHGALNAAEALHAELDRQRMLTQLYKTVANNRLMVTHNLIAQAATCDGMTAVQCRALLGSLETSLLLIERDGGVG